MVKILGIDFFIGTPADAHEQMTDAGGLAVFPAGPGLASDLRNNPDYQKALQQANFVFPDSGFMVLIWNFLCLGQPDRQIQRTSGLRYLRYFLETVNQPNQPATTFWVMPTADDAERNLQYLRSRGFHLSLENDCYLAPNYDKNTVGSSGDPSLLTVLQQQQPDFVILNIGGGVQEPLGHWLKNNLNYQPAILCTGAAIAFLSGGQADIPPWADRCYLGWLLRILKNPVRYSARYLNTLQLAYYLIRYRSNLPPLKP